MIPQEINPLQNSRPEKVQERRAGENQPDTAPHWIARLCDAVNQTLDDEAVPTDVFNRLTDFAIDLIADYAGKTKDQVRYLLPVALERASRNPATGDDQAAKQTVANGATE